MTTRTTSTAPSDADVLDQAAAVIATPRVEEGDSFILHAPLEVLARVGLLTMATPDARDHIRDRIASVAHTYATWGTPLDRQPDHPETLTADAERILAQALRTGDLDTVDDAITWLAAHLDTFDLIRALAAPVLPSLAAAAHGPILLHLLPRVAARSLPAAVMARTTIHELARHPTWNLNWFTSSPKHAIPDATDQDWLASELVHRLAKPHLPHQPESRFIHPTMSTTEQTGLAADTLADLTPGMTVTTARHHLLRVAAHSMLQDDPTNAPYGWSHCLTMPQAALGIAHATEDPHVAIAVAATYVLGFRATQGSVTLDTDYLPEPAQVEPDNLIAAPPPVAAAAAWHAPANKHSQIWRILANHAGAHHDAHLAKYTLACLDATSGDPTHHHLYRAAATYLNAWWHKLDHQTSN